MTTYKTTTRGRRLRVRYRSLERRMFESAFWWHKNRGEDIEVLEILDPDDSREAIPGEHKEDR